MTTPSDVKFEIGHVLFIDIVGYSKLLINEQSEQLQKLKEIVRGTEQFRLAEAEGKLLRLPTGDGGALVFRNSPEAPVLCALEIAKELKNHPGLRVRMGIHSGPVNEVTDLNEQANIAGAGINMAQRVMDCGDAGHILLSKRVTDDLEHYPQWRSLLHDLGEAEVKHGVWVHIFSLYNKEVGNPAAPERFRKAPAAGPPSPPTVASSSKPSLRLVLGIVSLAVLTILTILFVPGFFRSRNKAGTNPTSTNELQATSVPEKSIAVLPFENLSSDKENAYFADGIQDEILTRLSKIAALKVISRTSTQKYKSAPDNLREIGKQLGVANLLEGSVQKAADTVHINVQLIRAATDEHLWAESYNRKLNDIFTVEGEVAGAIADQLNAKLSGAEKQVITAKLTSNPDASDAYLRGSALFHKGDDASVDIAQQFLEQAVRLDPGFAAAWALLARLHAWQFSGSDATDARRAAARAALDTALHLQPDLAEVRLAQGYYQYWVENDYTAATHCFEQLLAKWPNNSEILGAFGRISERQGHWDQAGNYLERAVALDPMARMARQNAIDLRFQTREYRSALRLIDDGLNLRPDDLNLIACKVLVYEWLGQLDQADAVISGLHPRTAEYLPVYAITNQARFRRVYAGAISQLQAIQPDRGSGSADGMFSTFNLFLGDLRRLSGDATGAKANYIQARDALEALLKNQPNNADLYGGLAWVYCGLGDREAAMKNADRAVELMPVSKDAIAGVGYESTRARIEAQFGDGDHAIPALARLLNLPGYITPTVLRVDPDFDPLRNDPRFQTLCEEKPK